ncbi:MAG: polysaccharide biosynthesis protein [Roseateles depolymerans]|uniref:Polysaccharide biosynthesis protein n=1 Tax=Roseateles depolymerans TaxID=76731 RepID=A0A2W5FCF2_9BURK|nr:MAG: polysaccharide biosynthesis protein [Roseateles depolymerans]
MIWQQLDTLLTQLRPQRERLALALDALVVALAWQFTYLFRLGFERWFSARPDYDGWVLLGLVLVYAVVLQLFRVPKGMWRFSGFGEVKRLSAACLLAGLIVAVAVQMAHLHAVPRAVLALHPVFALMLLAMMRMGYRMLYEHMRSRLSGSAQEQRRALVMGAGQAGRLLLAGIQHQGWTVVGWLDDDPHKLGARVAGVPVLGRLQDVQAVCEAQGITHLIVAMPSASPDQRRRALELAGQMGRPVLTVPSPTELEAGRRVEQLRDIELEDLLGREPVRLDEAGLGEFLGGQIVLVTGAGGSIGSELCRQIARYRPLKLVLFDISEAALYAIEQELLKSHPGLSVVPLVGDVKEEARLTVLLAHYRVQLMFHAAAYKHVPMMEGDNAWTALSNNAIGSFHAARAAATAKVQRFVLISTDKAVNPTNVMGASKRLAELVVSAFAAEVPRTRFVTVRFGNVLGSSGSVIPKFKSQILAGGPVTVTHPDIIRYFMTIPEAARLVLQAALMGESGQVLLLDMGDPVRIVDLARDLIRLSGHTEKEIPIVFTGLRPGEKLYEELLADADTTLPTSLKQLRLAQLAPGPGLAVILDWVAEIEACPAFEDTFARAQLKRWVPEFEDGRLPRLNPSH